MNRNELETLLGELKLKTPADEIKADEREIIQKFLEAERQYQSQHKIKRLLWLSGIRQVKTFEQFDWHFNPGIAKEDILGFARSAWVESASNLVLIGDTDLVT